MSATTERDPGLDPGLDPAVVARLRRRWLTEAGSAFYDHTTRTEALACLRVLTDSDAARIVLGLHPVAAWHDDTDHLGCPTCRTEGACQTRVALQQPAPVPAVWLSEK